MHTQEAHAAGCDGLPVRLGTLNLGGNEVWALEGGRARAEVLDGSLWNGSLAAVEVMARRLARGTPHPNPLPQGEREPYLRTGMSEANGRRRATAN